MIFLWDVEISALNPTASTKVPLKQLISEELFMPLKPFSLTTTQI